MSVYTVTGKLRNGKTLVSVARIRDAIRKGKRIATNLDLDLVAMFGKKAKNIELIRIPDKPSLQDLQAIGSGYDGDYDDEKFGLLVLDECGTWFNSRNWQDKSRKDVNDWFLHSGKLGWDVYIIIQDISLLDTQAREAICEKLVVCRRLDNLRLPLIGTPFKMLTGINLTLPRIHRAKVTYADGLLCDVWVYRGNDLFNCYDTRQLFLQDYPHATHSILPPWHTHGRYLPLFSLERFMRFTKIYWKRFKSPVSLATGFLFGSIAMMYYNAYAIEEKILNANFNRLHHRARSNALEQPSREMPVQQSGSDSSSSHSDKSETPQLNRLTQFLANLRISGHYSVNNNTTYTFTNGKPDQYYTSEDLKGMGFAVVPIGECSAKLTLDELSQVIRCY